MGFWHNIPTGEGDRAGSVSSAIEVGKASQDFKIRRKYLCEISPKLPSLGALLDVLEAFHNFEPDAKAAAIALCAKESGVDEIHFYKIEAVLLEIRGQG